MTYRKESENILNATIYGTINPAIMANLLQSNVAFGPIQVILW